MPGAYQSAGLVAHTRILARMAQDETDEMELVTLTTATILMAAAAMEAVLLEAAYILKPSLYENIKFRNAGAPTKFQEFTGHTSQEVTDLWNARIAVAHSEPDNTRTRFVGVKLNAQGAEWVANCVENISKQVWGAFMPKWFSETTGIT
jgi:hypothetical protein